jgi:hypothetical protein
MGTIRRALLPSDGITLIRNAWMHDDRLSWEARGLLAWFATFPQGMEITELAVADATGAELSAVASGPMGELEECGYLIPDPTSDAPCVAFTLNDPHA